jgi:probable rRNA maturation factor
MPPRRISIDVDIKTHAWREVWPKAAADARRVLTVASQRPELQAKAGGTIALVFADDATLQDLNGRFRGKDKPTNVLSFPGRGHGTR